MNHLLFPHPLPFSPSGPCSSPLSLPILSLRPQMLALNCNLTKMSVIDINGVLSFFDLEAKGGAPGTQGEHLAFERKVRGGRGAI